MTRYRPAAPGNRGLRLLGLALLRLQRLTLRRPRLALALAFLLAVAAATGLARSRVLLAARDLADAGMPSARWAAEEEASFGAEESLFLVFHPLAPSRRFSAAELGAIRDWIASERRGNGDALRFFSSFDVMPAGAGSRGAPVVDAARPETLAGLRETPWAAVLTDREGRDVALQVAFRAGNGSRWFGSFDPAPVLALERRCRERLLGAQPGIGLHLAGNAAYDRYALDGVRRFRYLNVAVLLLLVAAFRLLCGTWRGGLLLALVLGWSALLVYGGMGLAGAPIDLLSVGLFLLLAVAVVEDALFLAREHLAQPGPWRRPFRLLLLPGFLTSLTTVVGFASLCVAETAIVRRLGLWGATGALLEWAATFLLQPALLVAAPRLRGWTDPRRAVALRLPDRLAALRLPRAAAWVLLAAVALGAVAAPRLNFNDTPVAMFAPGHPCRDALEYLRRTRGWVGQLSVVLPPEAGPGEIERLTAALGADPAVAGVLDPWTVLRHLSGDDPFRLAALASDPAGGAAATALRGAGGRLRVAVFVREADVVALGRLRDRVTALYPAGEGFPAGELMTYADFGEVVPRTLLESLATCLGLVVVLIALLYRALGLHLGARPVLASLWGPALSLAVVAFLQVPVNFLTSVFASVLVGLTGDNALQFACAAARRRLAAGIERRGGAALLVAGLMAAAALVFLGSAFVPPRHLGLLLAGGVAFGAAGDIWILAGLVRGPARRLPAEGAP